MDRVWGSSLESPIPAGEATSSSPERLLPHGLQKINDSVYLVDGLLENPSVEIVFFHGLSLDGSKETYWTTWLSSDGSELWLRWILKEFPCARILMVSYDPSIKRRVDWGSRNICEIGKKLVRDLTNARVGNRGCPVVFVGHSVGCVVMKELCIRHECTGEYIREYSREYQIFEGFPAFNGVDIRGNIEYNGVDNGVDIRGNIYLKKYSSEYSSVLSKYYLDQYLSEFHWSEWESIHSSAKSLSNEYSSELLFNLKGLFYYSCPNLGLELPHSSASTFPEGRLVQDVTISNEQLERTNRVFREVRKDYGWITGGIGERLPTTLGQWKKVIVSEASARYDSDEFYTVNADHFDVCRPESPSNSTYLLLSRFIARALEKAAGQDSPSPASYMTMDADIAQRPDIKLKKNRFNLSDELSKAEASKDEPTKLAGELSMRQPLQNARLPLDMNLKQQAMKSLLGSSAAETLGTGGHGTGSNENKSDDGSKEDETSGTGGHEVGSSEKNSDDGSNDDEILLLHQLPEEGDVASQGTHAVKLSAAHPPPPSGYKNAKSIKRRKLSMATGESIFGTSIESVYQEKSTENFERKSVMGLTLRPGEDLGIKQLSVETNNLRIEETADKCMTRDGTPESRLLMCFIGLVKDRDEEGYFVSSEWLLSLQENERESLMSVLWGAGYAEACQTTTTTLFARIENDVEGGTSTEASGSFILTGKRVDKYPGEIQGLSMDKKPEISTQEIANNFGSDNPRESSSAIDDGRRRHVATWESFQAAINSKRQERFCVSTQWISHLNGHEKEALVQSLTEAKYVQISQSSETTWYVRFRGEVRNLPRPAGDDDASRSSNKNNSTSGNVEKLGIWNLFGWLRPKRNMNDEDNLRGSSDAANRVETSQIQDGKSSVCHPQLLTVTCSSSSEPSTVLPLNGNVSEDFSRFRFGDSTVTIPRMGPSQNISTSMEKSFSITKIEFVDGRSREASMDLKAIATTSLSCCVKMDRHLQKVHFKFSKISGEVRNVEPEEEWCNAIVVSSVYTSVFGCSKRRTNPYNMEPIDLFLDDEYCRSGGRRVSEGDPSTGDLVWIENAERTPDSCEPGSTTIVLQREIERRRLEDSRRPVQGAYPLLFQNRIPVKFEGEVSLAHYRHTDSFLQFRVRYQLQVSYFKPSRAILEEGPVWYAINTTKLIDFGPCLTFTTESF